MPSFRVLCRNFPQRVVVLATLEYALVFRHDLASKATGVISGGYDVPPCLVEFSTLSALDLNDYRPMGRGYGTLGLITLNREVFLCIVTAYSHAATVRPGGTVLRVDNVDFYCLSNQGYDGILSYSNEPELPVDEASRSPGCEGRDLAVDYPFLTLKKLLSDGSFYYSFNFNLTERLQNQLNQPQAVDIEALNEGMLWNSYMISPLLHFRRNLAPTERLDLDISQVLIFVIRGFSSTIKIPGFGPPAGPALLTIISRQSSQRAGTRFNSRGIDDSGNVANFVETETVLWAPSGAIFSYVQVRGSLPIFWEQAPGLIPGQQKIDVTRPTEATQHAFNKHFDLLALRYGAVHVVNLLSEEKPGEADLSTKFRYHIARSPLKQQGAFSTEPASSRLELTEYDFHAESRSSLGYGTSAQLKYTLSRAIQKFAYFLGETGSKNTSDCGIVAVFQQKGIFRTNCLDCLDRTNLVQTIISSATLESFLHGQGMKPNSGIDIRHSTLWADNGDALAKIYAGTGAIKSSFTRYGKMSLAGALADARKSATRLYINNFSDKLRQNTIDLLLGRLANQVPVRFDDPMNDSVSEELMQRASEYMSSKTIKIWTGTFNVNGRSDGQGVDLTPWLFPLPSQKDEDPIIFAVAFQEIVPLNPQQIMSTDDTTRKAWESAISNCLRSHSRSKRTESYVLLRSVQLVGAALMVYVRKDVIHEIRNVEASTKKTGLQGMSGNKGGCAIRFEYSNTRLCFVSGHFAAGVMNYQERNKDYETVYHGLEFRRNKSIKDHDEILWFGDFNYRISLENGYVRKLASQGKYQELFTMDQLNHQMSAGAAFPSFLEGLVTFPPTYKYDVGTDDYDTSEKARIPAWCDRVLWRGPNLRQVYYDTANLRLSDHRPVWAIFDCAISVIDESRKDKLRRDLYSEGQQRAWGMHTDKIGHSRAANPEARLFPAVSLGYHKWWLDNDTSERSSLQSPGSGLFPNPFRKSNPFILDAEAYWTLVPSDKTGDAKCSAKHVTSVSPDIEGMASTQQQASSGRHGMNQKTASKTSGRVARSADVSAPYIPPKPSSLRPARITESEPVGRMNSDSARVSNGFPVRQPSLARDRYTNVLYQQNEFQYRTVLPLRNSRPVEHKETKNGVEDLLGADMSEKIDWRPLL